MPLTGTITINHCIIELEKTLREHRIEFQKQVTKKEMTPHTRDSRIAILETLLQVCYKAAKDINTTISDELKNLPK